MTLGELNTLDSAQAAERFRQCCGSRAWADAMASRRPFESVPAMVATGREIWRSLKESDWLEAFAAHPRIGVQSRGWSSEEQRGMQVASSETASKIHGLNEAYHEKFGWIFIICAAGKTAEEMRAALEQRLANDAQTELQIAAGEQERITELRIQKLLSE